MLSIQTGKLPKLSEQQIVDCTWGFGNKGCKGGYPYRALQWIIKHGGVATKESYGRYLAQVRLKSCLFTMDTVFIKYPYLQFESNCMAFNFKHAFCREIY